MVSPLSPPPLSPPLPSLSLLLPLSAYLSLASVVPSLFCHPSRFSLSFLPHTKSLSGTILFTSSLSFLLSFSAHSRFFTPEGQEQSLETTVFLSSYLLRFSFLLSLCVLFSLLISLVSFSRLSNGIFGELLASWFLLSSSTSSSRLSLQLSSFFTYIPERLVVG